MRTIHHYQIAPGDGWQLIQLPEGAVPIKYQGSIPGKMWAIVDDAAPLVATPIAVIGTGWEVPKNAVHVHTDIGPTGYVWHLFVSEGGE